MKQPGIDNWKPNVTDTEKISRTKNRGTIVSMILMTSALLQSLLKGMGASTVMLLLLYGFIMASVIEEWLLKPRIMKDNTGINPVIIALALSIWTYLLGMPGGLIAIPMTGLMIIIFKQYFLKPYQEVIKD